MRWPTYIILSLVLVLVLCSGYVYSYVFYPNQHPVVCVIKKFTGKDCPSCGFSKAFSYYSHFQIASGKNSNENSFPVLLFFVFQFTLRFAVLIWFFTTHKVIDPRFIKIELIISISFFLLAFLPLLINF